MKSTTINIIFWGVGGALIVIFAVFMGSFNNIYANLVDQKIELSESNDEMMKNFKEPPGSILISFKFFDVQNADMVIAYGHKPILKERGPYVYTETKSRKSVEIQDQGTTVFFKPETKYVFNANASHPLTEEDKITTLNIMPIVLMQSDAVPEIVKVLAWSYIENIFPLYETHTVKELLFEGWELPNIDMEIGIPGHLYFHINGTIPELAKKFGFEVPEIIADNRIGYYKGTNLTIQSNFSIYTGKDDMSKYQDIVAWNGNDRLDIWNDDFYCNSINGTEGIQFPPRSLKEGGSAYIFQEQLCRSLKLDYASTETSHQLNMLRFKAGKKLLESGNTNPDNKCYCGSLGCLGDSMLEITACKGVPVIMSTPHFYMGDKSEIAKYIGLDPKQDLHETFMDIEPNIGIPVFAHKRLQLNMPLRYVGVPMFKAINALNHPVFWIDEHGGLTDGQLQTLFTQVRQPYLIVYSVSSLLIALGLLLVIAGGYRRHRMRKRTEL